jgi:hypothetical protein
MMPLEKRDTEGVLKSSNPTTNGGLPDTEHVSGLPKASVFRNEKCLNNCYEIDRSSR